MSEVWPAALEQLVDSQSFSYKYGKTTIETDVDIGPKKKRRRFTRPINTATVSFRATKAQLAIFKTFYNTTINGGVTQFQFTDPLDDTLKFWRTSEPEIRPLGGSEFTISMEWEEMP